MSDPFNSMSSYTTDVADLRLEGALEKKSDFLGRYNYRLVHLGENGILRWFTETGAVKGAVSLAHAEVAMPTSGEDAEIILKVPGKGDLIFRAADYQTRETWVVALKEIAFKATAEKAKMEEDRKRLKNFGGLPPPPPKPEPTMMQGVGPDPVVEPAELGVKGTAVLTNDELAKLTDTEALALESAMDEHNARAQGTAERAEKAAAELRKVREQQSGGARGKELRLAELDSASAELTKHKELLLSVVESESRSRGAINSAEGAARSAAERLGTQEQKRRAELKALEDEHAVLLEDQKKERADLSAQLTTAMDTTSKADSSVQVALTMVELRKEQLTGLETLLTAKEHDRDVAKATLKGQESSRLDAAKRKEGVETELAAMITSAAEMAKQVIEMQNQERADKLLAASKEQRLIAAQAGAAEFASVMASQRTHSHDPTHAPSAYTEHAAKIAEGVKVQLEMARQFEVNRARDAAEELSKIKAKVQATEAAIKIKKEFVKDLADAYLDAESDVEKTKVVVSATVELCEALTSQRSYIQEEIKKLEATLVTERAASKKAKKSIEDLRLSEKALTLAHEQAVAAIDALLVEERARLEVLAEKRTPLTLPVESSVFIKVPDEGTGSDKDVPMPTFFEEAIEEVTTRLASLVEMREVVLRDHAADAKQLAAVATEASAREALAAAESAAQARAQAALAKYEAALG